MGQDLADSVIYVPIKDSLLSKDTTKPKGDLDAIVDYSAKDSAIFDLTGDKLFLYNEGHLKFKEYDLKAAQIILFRQSTIMEANGIPDTVKVGKYTGTPVFMEGTKKYEAFKLRYNFKTRQGNIEMGSTELEGGYYLGEKIKKVDEDIFFVQNGRYTTCDKADPDFYFSGPRMKIIQGDKVIAEPVYLCIDEVPIFAIPFGVFPNHSGRTSGIIPPAYGEDATYGRYLAHLGYFWATNDYMDLALQGNYYTKGRIDLSSRYRYALRYKLTGSVELGGSRIRLGEANDFDRTFSDEWQIAVNHNQTINPTTNLTANVNFLSSKNYYTNSTNSIPDLLRQNAISNITLSKYWEGTLNSASINYHRDQNLTTGEVSEVIPNMSFSRSQSFPFRSKKTSLLNLTWYEELSYTYNANLLYQESKTLVDASINNGNFKKNSRGGIKQAVGINAPMKISEITISPFFNYNEIWYNKSIIKTFNPADSTVTTNDVTGFKTFRTFNSGISLYLKLIGLFKTDILGVKGFRHTVTPSVSYLFQPDFSKSQWNNYGSYIDQSGNAVKYSYFEREVFGSPGSGEQQILNFALGNIFEMKVKDTDSTDKKFQMLNLTAGINYNFAADSIRFSELGLNYRTDIGNILGIGGGVSFNLYKYVDGVGRINKYLWNEEKRLAQLTNFNINVSTTLQGGKSLNGADSVKNSGSGKEYSGIFGDRPIDYSIPWSVNINYNYSINQSIPSIITKSSNISANLNFSLTKNWRFTLTSAFDIFQKQFASPYVTIYRDLHCWEFSFLWTPLGTYRGYKFELRIKASQLQDVKVNKQSNYRGVY